MCIVVVLSVSETSGPLLGIDLQSCNTPVREERADPIDDIRSCLVFFFVLPHFGRALFYAVDRVGGRAGERRV